MLSKLGIFSIFRLAINLGLKNIYGVLAYRLSIKFRYSRVRRLRATFPSAPFFEPASSLMNKLRDVRTEARLGESAASNVKSESFPLWLTHPLSGEEISNARQWWEIPDFDPRVGDIKLIWNLSRFDWVLDFSRQSTSGDAFALRNLDAWIADWGEKNPPYFGPNWKCGQEVAIRVMHLMVGNWMLRRDGHAAEGLVKLIEIHLDRIEPTLGYATAQDNNHGTSEAAAMYMGGSLLEAHGISKGRRFKDRGRHLLENRVQFLIGEHGSFSQYSLNYHRLMLDTLSMVEVCRRRFGAPEFSNSWRKKAFLATNWMFHIIDPQSGDGANVGANDGAKLFNLANTEYREHRPSVQLAMALFGGQRAYAAEGFWNQPLYLLDILIPINALAAPKNFFANDAGFAMLRLGGTFALLRYPRFRFRPSQADALHVDFWVDGVNVLRDGGTYGYNVDSRTLNYFGGTVGHNTIEFDGRDQMRRVGRFLFADWIKDSSFQKIGDSIEGGVVEAQYFDYLGASHKRRLLLDGDELKITDHVNGFKRRAVIRWRLFPGAWKCEGNKVQLGCYSLSVSSSVKILRFELVEGMESREYMKATSVPVLEVEIDRPGSFHTSFRWKI